MDVDEIAPSDADDGYLLVLARLLRYRRIDLAVAACTRLGRPLVVVGDGPELAGPRRLAGPTVEFRGFVPRAEAVDLLRRCHAYLVPGVEDFGIAPVEAMSAGKPVVAFRAGGATDGCGRSSTTTHAGLRVTAIDATPPSRCNLATPRSLRPSSCAASGLPCGRG